MRKMMVVLLFLPFMFVFARTSAAKALDSENITSLKNEIDARKNAIPEDPLTLSDERNWASQKMDYLQDCLSMSSENESITQLDRIKEEWTKCKEGIKALTPQSTDEGVKDEINSLSSLLNQLRRFCFEYDLDESKEYNDLFSFVTSNNISPKGAKDFASMPPIKKGQFINDLKVLADKELVDQLIDSAYKLSKEEKEKNNALKQSCIQTMNDLKEYSSEINENIRKAQSKSSLNQYIAWLFAGIGIFCIMALASMRFFDPRIAFEWVSSGQLLQLITVIILLFVVMALGLTGVIKDNTVSTLLGGIAGYVLSHGVRKAAPHDREPDNSTSPSPPAEPDGAPGDRSQDDPAGG